MRGREQTTSLLIHICDALSFVSVFCINMHIFHSLATVDHTLKHVHMCCLIMCICGYCISAGHPSCGKAAVGSVQHVWPGLFIQPSLAINHLLSAGCLHGKRPPHSASEQRCSLWRFNIHPHVHGGEKTHSLTHEANVKNRWVDRCSATERLSSSCWIYYFYILMSKEVVPSRCLFLITSNCTIYVFEFALWPHPNAVRVGVEGQIKCFENNFGLSGSSLGLNFSNPLLISGLLTPADAAT